MSDKPPDKSAEDKRQKMEPKEVGLIDVLIEIRELKAEVRRLDKKLNDHISSSPYRRIG